MIDIRLIRENPDLVKENIRKKFQNSKLRLVDEIKQKDAEWRELKQGTDTLRSERNKISESINQAKKQKKDPSEFLKKAKEIPKKLQELEEKEAKLAEEIRQMMYQIPNIIHSSVPIGKDASENVVSKTIGKPKKQDFQLLTHGEIAEKLSGADFDSARSTSGNGFYFLRGNLAELDMALINYAKDFMLKQGFELYLPPLMIRSKVVEGVMSFQERDNMMYKIEGEDLYMIGTSEHPLIGSFIDRTLKKDQLPIKITGFSPCFRKEIGSRGIDEKGFFRVHQFNKQEMIVVCEPKESYDWYDKMLSCTLEIFKSLEIPIRVLECCSGDLGDLKAKSCDVEAWSPRQEKYFEVGSLTNMEAAQARRLNIKIEYKGEKYFAHTLNNTALATSRAMVAILENFQQKEGSIRIPDVLQKYTGFKVIKIGK